MENRQPNRLNVILSITAPLLTAVSILIGVHNFNSQQRENTKMELNKKFWDIQNQLYTDICNNAGALAAALGNKSKFQAEKEQFLSRYYGQMILVEDKNVEKCMIEIKYFLDAFNPEEKDPQMEILFKKKILLLSEACKNSSLTFKSANLK